MSARERLAFGALASLALVGCGALLGIGDLDVRSGGGDGGLDGPGGGDGAPLPDGAGADASSDAPSEGGPPKPGGICSDDGWCWTNPLPVGTDFNSIWASSSSDVWAFGAVGTAMHYAASSWTRVVAPTTNNLNSSWGFAADDIWVVGDGGVILQWTGSKWNVSVAGGGEDLYAIHGLAPNDLWAAGRSGTVRHYDGTSWQDMSSGVTQNFYGVSAASAHDVFFGGQAGTFVYYGMTDAGLGFTAQTIAVPGDLNGLTAVSPQDVWAVGDKGAIVHVTAAAGVEILPQVSQTLEKVLASSATDIWAIGGTAAHYDGNAWTEEIPGTSYYIGEHLVAPGEVWAAGYSGSVVHRSGGAWSELRQGPSANLYGIGGSGPNDVWATGANGTCLHWTGASWTPLSPGDTRGLYSVWVAPSGEMWAAGEGGYIVHYKSGAFVNITSFTTQDINALWGSAENDVWAAGASGEIASLRRHELDVRDEPGDDGALRRVGTLLERRVDLRHGRRRAPPRQRRVGGADDGVVRRHELGLLRRRGRRLGVGRVGSVGQSEPGDAASAHGLVGGRRRPELPREHDAVRGHGHVGLEHERHLGGRLLREHRALRRPDVDDETIGHRRQSLACLGIVRERRVGGRRWRCDSALRSLIAARTGRNLPRGEDPPRSGVSPSRSRFLPKAAARNSMDSELARPMLSLSSP